MSELIKRINNILLYRVALRNLAINELKSKYRNSILGFFWAIINPILIMVAINFIFTVIFKVEMRNFFLFVLAGIFPWMFFSTALSEATCSILNQKNILRQFNMPKEILPLSSILACFFNFLIGWIAILPLFMFFHPKIILFLPLLIIVFLANLIFVFGLGLAFSILNVFFRDVSHFLGVLLMLWFWVTPIFYSLDMIPGKFHWIFNVNPMVPYIIYYRNIVFEGFIPSYQTFVGIFLWAILSITLGLWIFSRFESRLLERI
jgi:ABC-2 type transport system permease protein